MRDKPGSRSAEQDCGEYVRQRGPAKWHRGGPFFLHHDVRSDEFPFMKLIKCGCTLHRSVMNAIGRHKLIRAVAVAGVTLMLSVAHAATNSTHVALHVFYQDLSYAPILVAAYWFGIAGGVSAALVAAAGTVAHFHHTWSDNQPFVFGQYGQAIGFMITGAVGGALASAQRAATLRYQQGLVALQAANAELRTSHEQLLRADRLSKLGEIAAGLAHEVRNPLASIKGALEIISARAQQGSPEAEFTSLATHEIERVQKLIAEFLAYAKPHEPQRQEADVFDLLDPVITLLTGEAERHAVILDVRRTAVPAVSVDPEQIGQVFFNVVLNAVQVTPSRGRVSVTASPNLTSRTLAVDVKDEGPGIRPDHLARVFDPFFTTKKTGTGLGLSISQRIVQSHQGTIDILQPGQGTVVRVQLPLASAGHTSARPGDSEAAS